MSNVQSTEWDVYFPVREPPLNIQSRFPEMPLLRAMLLQNKPPCSIPNANTVQGNMVQHHRAVSQPNAMPQRDIGINNKYTRSSMVAEHHSEATPRSFGQSCSTSSILKTQGVFEKIPRNSSVRDVYDIAPEIRKEIVDLFDKGLNRSDIMKRFCLFPYQFKQVLYAAGRTGFIREGDQKRYQLLRPLVLKRFKRGWPYQKISEHAKTNIALVDRILSSAGLIPKTQPGQSVTADVPVITSSLPSIKQKKNEAVSITKLQEMLGISGCPEEITSFTRRPPNPAAEEAHPPNSANNATTNMFWLEKLLKEDGLTPELRPRSFAAGDTVATFPLQFADHNEAAAITERDARLRDLLSPEKLIDPCTMTGNGHHDPAAENWCTPSPGSEVCGSTGILLNDRQCSELFPIEEDAMFCPKEGDNAYDPNVLKDRARADIVDVGVDMNIAPVQPLGWPSITANRCMETAPELSLLQPDSASTSDLSQRFQCQICHLSWDEEEAFLLHLTNKEHEQLFAIRTFLYCTGCLLGPANQLRWANILLNTNRKVRCRTVKCIVFQVSTD
ncbi:uncharacterized protein LOC129592237 [Paramacrobiotus metropolitanus]|uniref:uncharacterized protein LOC129592237 n=1 Tax=Paramacrobiotus metropolitanus TaxID=2943436 RepID=UPI0024456BB2|nr:uncharacterized protein LOC129592237 [Paramacrobiotus metropolitanus]